METIRKIAASFDKLFQGIIEQGKNIGYGEWLLFFSGMVVLRTFIINLEQGLPDKTTTFLTAFFLQDFFFFWAVLVLVWLWLSFWLRIRVADLAGVIYWGTWLVILPLIIDLVWAGKIYWSFYLLSSPQELFRQYVSFFGHLPPAVVYFGTRISAGLAVALTSAFVFWRSRSLWRTAVNALFVYSVFFFAASLPSWVAFLKELLQGKDFLAITTADVAGTILSPAQVWGIDYRLLSSAIMFKLNLAETVLLSIITALLAIAISGRAATAVFLKGKWIELSLSALCLVAGLHFGIAIHPGSSTADLFSFFALGAILAAALAGGELASILHKREKSQETFFLATVAAFGLLAPGVKFFLFGLSWLTLAVILRSERLRLNRVPLFPKIIQALPFLAAMNLGFMLSSPDQSLVNFPWQSGIWLVIGLAFFPLYQAEKWKTETLLHPWKRTLVGGAYFTFFSLAPYVFKKPEIFGWSLLAGAAAFWLLERPFVRQKTWLNLIFWSFFLLVFLVA